MQVPEGIPGGDLDSSPDKRTDLSKRNFELINNVLVFHKTRQLIYPVVGEMTHPPWIERNMPIMFKNVHPFDFNCRACSDFSPAESIEIIEFDSSMEGLDPLIFKDLSPEAVVKGRRANVGCRTWA